MASAGLCVAVMLAGCAQFHGKPADKYVYVTAKETYLKDRIAAVSNRTGNVENGEKLIVLERARRYVKVKTPQGQIGWIQEKDVASQQTFDAFDALSTKHAKDPAVGNGTVRDIANLHIAPGRETEHFFLLAEGDKLQILARATLPKAVAPGAQLAKPVARPVVKAAIGKLKTGSTPAAEAVPALPPAMEDWWLVRDAKGHTGWLLSRLMEVDAPEALTRYAEGQRIVGAYVLAHVNDPESGQLRDGHPDPDIPIYVTVLSAYKAGLPYDFDQVRVFTWNLKKHRYETAFREKNIEGYLPVVVNEAADPYGHAANSAVSLPSFTYRVLAAEAPAPVPDAVTGLVAPGKTIAKTYRLEGNVTRRVLAPGSVAPAEAHPVPEAEKKGKKRKK
ncbi:MAG: SH3 domain-containing protein [Acidobacteriaceae bacterium]